MFKQVKFSLSRYPCCWQCFQTPKKDNRCCNCYKVFSHFFLLSLSFVKPSLQQYSVCTETPDLILPLIQNKIKKKPRVLHTKLEQTKMRALLPLPPHRQASDGSPRPSSIRSCFQSYSTTNEQQYKNVYELTTSRGIT